MWILVITLYWHSGLAVSSVPGFQSQEACIAAAGFWLQRQRALNNYSTADAICVKDR
jgi:hypothetical protein